MSSLLRCLRLRPSRRPKRPLEKVLSLKNPRSSGAVVVADVTDDLRTALNLPKEIQGAVIVELDSASPAAQAGLHEGDVIQEANKQPVKNAKDLVALSKKLKPNEKILMRVYSQSRSGYVALEPK